MVRKFKLLDEFKAFALGGNMVDLAVGVIAGAAFTNVVSSLVNDILMPPLGLLIGGIEFSDLSLNIHLPGSAKPPIPWNIGAFFTTLLDFMIVSVSIFVIVKVMNRLRGVKPQKVPENKICSECLMSIPEKAKRCSYCTSLQE